MSMEDRRAGWTAGDHRPGPVVEFDYGALEDEGSGETAQPEITPEQLQKVFDVLLSGKLHAKTVAIRTVALGHLVQHWSVHRMDLAALSKRLGVTRAAMSRVSRALRDQLGVRASFGRSEAAREVFRQTARRVHSERKGGA
jgi:hypothetical protein